MCSKQCESVYEWVVVAKEEFNACGRNVFQNICKDKPLFLHRFSDFILSCLKTKIICSGKLEFSYLLVLLFLKLTSGQSSFLCSTGLTRSLTTVKKDTLFQRLSYYMVVRNGCAILVASEMWLGASVALITVLSQHDSLNLSIVTIFCEIGSCCPFLWGGKHVGLSDFTKMT